MKAKLSRMPVICMLNASLVMGPILGFAAAANHTASAANTVAADEQTPILVVQYDGFGSALPDANDAGLRSALEMLGLRISELPDELLQFSPNDDDEILEMKKVLDKVLPWAAALLSNPVEFAVVDNGVNDFGVDDLDARLVVNTGDATKANYLAQSLTSLIRTANPDFPFTASESNPKMLEVKTPLFTVMFGPDDIDNSLFVIGLDMGGDGIKANPVSLQVPAGFGNVDPIFQCYMNIDAGAKVAGRLVGMAGNPQVSEEFDKNVGKFLQGPSSFNAAMAYVGDRLVSITKSSDFGDDISGLMGSVAPPLSPEVLSLIPADARVAQVVSYDLSNLAKNIVSYIAPQLGMDAADLQIKVDTKLDEIAEQFGVHPVEDLINNFGPTWACYTSESTGGGGMASMVMVNSGIHAKELGDTFTTLSTMANSLNNYAYGYVRIRTWSLEEYMAGGADSLAFSLQFPGLPIPLEISMAIAGDNLVAALSPQTLIAGLKHCGNDESDLSNNPRFIKAWKDLESILGDSENITQISFQDTPKMIAGGYPVVQALGTGLANLVRSPADPTREPGLVVPMYDQLVKDANATLALTFMDNNSMMKISTSDGSALVNTAAAAGSGGMLPLVLVVLGVGAAVLASNNKM